MPSHPKAADLPARLATLCALLPAINELPLQATAPTGGSFTDVPVASESVSVRDADDGVDVTLIRWMLSLSPEERLAVLQGFVDSIVELTHDSPAAQVQRSA